MSRYTKAHHTDTAAILRGQIEAWTAMPSPTTIERQVAFTALEEVRAKFADLYQRDDPAFNRARFKAECEPKGGQ